jgi:preprotein translocase subunit SecA
VKAYPEIENVINNKKERFGEAVWDEVFMKLALQTIDALWVEHLEVMGYTRSSVGLRAYGQRDPLIEYRKEGVRLFKDLQQAFYDRMASLLPAIEPRVVLHEEVERKQESAAAQANAGHLTSISTETKSSPVRSGDVTGRNQIVTITNGTETKSIKYKKAVELLESGWTVVS